MVRGQQSHGMTDYYDESLELVAPSCLSARWRVEIAEELEGWEVVVQERELEDWGDPVVLFLKGRDFHPVDAVRAFLIYKEANQ